MINQVNNLHSPQVGKVATDPNSQNLTEHCIKLGAFEKTLPKFLVHKLFLILAENEVQDAVSLSSTCRRFRAIFQERVENLFKIPFSKIPELEDYALFEKYYEYYTKHMFSIKNIKNGNFLISKPITILRKEETGTGRQTVFLKCGANVLGIKESDKFCILNMLDNKYYKINDLINQKVKKHFFGKFLILEQNSNLDVLDLISLQHKIISLITKFDKEYSCRDLISFARRTIDKTTLHLSDLDYPNTKSLITVSSDKESTHINIWNLETGTCDKTIKNIADHSCKQEVTILCERLPCVAYQRPESTQMRMVVHDIEKDKSYEYLVNTNLVGDQNISFHPTPQYVFIPYVNNKYIAYFSSSDESITFINRESGQHTFVDLGSIKQNTSAVQVLRKYKHWNDRSSYSIQMASLNEEKDLFLCAEKKTIKAWNLKTGQICAEYVLENNTSIWGSIVRDHLLTVIAVDSSHISQIFLEIDSLKLHDKLNMKFAINFGKIKSLEELSGEHFIFISAPPPYTIGSAEIYHTKLQKKVTLDLSLTESYDFKKFSSWKNFLAVPGKEDQKNYICVFDIDSGKRLARIPISFTVAPTSLKLEWLNGGILVKYSSAEGVFTDEITPASYPSNGIEGYFINFNKRLDPKI